MEMLISFSSRTWHLHTLPKVPNAGSMTMVLLCLIGHRESMGIVKRKMRDTRPNNADDPKAIIKATWASNYILCNIQIFWDTEFWVFIICNTSVSIIIKISRNKGLKYFTLCVMNLYNIWVSHTQKKNIYIYAGKSWPNGRIGLIIERLWVRVSVWQGL